jgi:hypothetical protein
MMRFGWGGGCNQKTGGVSLLADIAASSQRQKKCLVE